MKLKFKDYTGFALLIPVMIAVLANLPGCYNSGRQTAAHACEYSECPFKGEERFVSGCGSCDQGSDCWALDSIHFAHPTLDYDQCDSILTSK